MRVALAVLGAVVALGAAAPAAGAADAYYYRVTAEGTGTQTYVKALDHHGDAQVPARIDFTYELDLAEVEQLPDGSAYPLRRHPDGRFWASTGEISGTATLQVPAIPDEDGGVVPGYTCTGHESGALLPDLDHAPDSTDARLELDVAGRKNSEDLEGYAECPGNEGIAFDLPRLDEAKFLFRMPRPGKRSYTIPWKGSSACETGANCRVSWDGVLRFELSRTRGGGDARRCVVPRLARLSRQSAVAKLRSAGCKARVVHTRHAKVRKGYVIRASAKAGARLPRGTTVTLTVSRGGR